MARRSLRDDWPIMGQAFARSRRRPAQAKDRQSNEFSVQTDSCYEMSHDRPSSKGKDTPVYAKALKLLSLLEPPSSNPAFSRAIDLLTRDWEAGRAFCVNGRRFRIDRLGPASLSFLPDAWAAPFDKGRDHWSGCETWWAGYPMIAWVELRRSSDDYRWQLRLNCEVGPLCPADLRKELIGTIKRFAAQDNLDRIQFTSNATKARSLYSRFLKGGTIDLERADDAALIASQIEDLLEEFEPELQVVARSLCCLFDP